MIYERNIEMLIILGGLIGLVMVIAINYIIAKKFEGIAQAKGYYKPAVNAFAICFWLGIVGYLYIIALPNKTLDVMQLNHQKKIIEFLENINNKLNSIEESVKTRTEDDNITF